MTPAQRQRCAHLLNRIALAGIKYELDLAGCGGACGFTAGRYFVRMIRADGQAVVIEVENLVDLVGVLAEHVEALRPLLDTEPGEANQPDFTMHFRWSEF